MTSRRGRYRNQRKDLGLVLEAGRHHRVSQPVTRLTHELYSRLVEAG